MKFVITIWDIMGIGIGLIALLVIALLMVYYKIKEKLFKGEKRNG